MRTAATLATVLGAAGFIALMPLFLFPEQLWAQLGFLYGPLAGGLMLVLAGVLRMAQARRPLTFLRALFMGLGLFVLLAPSPLLIERPGDGDVMALAMLGFFFIPITSAVGSGMFLAAAAMPARKQREQAASAVSAQ